MLRWLNIATVVAVFAALSYEYVVPAIAAGFYKSAYQTLMYECDYAMKDHFIAKRSVEESANEGTIKNLEAAEISLLNCHEYDELRKRLKLYNVSDTMLSAMGLETLERKNYQLSEFVKIHEIRY